MRIIPKGRKYYLEHRLSPKLRAALGKSKLSKCLHTESKTEANRRAIPLEYEWRRMITEAQCANGDSLRKDVAYWRRSLEDAGDDDDRELTRALMADELEQRTLDAARHEGVDLDDHDAIDDLPEAQRGREVYLRATGQKVELDEYLDEYLGRSNSAPKEKDQTRATVERVKEYAPFLSDVSLSTMQRYFDDRAAAGLARSTLQKELSGARGYWRWLSRRLESVDPERDPFKVDLAAPSKKQDTKRKAYTSAQAVALLRSAVSKPDPRLADLIRLGMFTGARLEELCVMTTDDAKLGDGLLTIRDAKTLAGIRDVPIHARLRPVVERLVRDSSDGYLIDGLKRDKYGKRSPAIGKRFGRLKKSHGFGPLHVFHSFRHTIKTQLRNAGVPRDIQNELLGHEQDDEMMGVYYDPTLTDGRKGWQTIQAKAMGRISYPDLDDSDMA